MRAVDVIRAVRDRSDLPAAALQQFIDAIVRGEVPDYQASAFLMAVCTRGLAPELVVALTLAMRDSGQVVDLSASAGRKVDKHSTGGVGDKISLPLAPLVAACGVPVPMVSGRGLGHTGGTLDKLAAIPGFRTDVDLNFFAATVKSIGACMMGQSGALAPADRILYALRDVTATVESIPLITASILAKKLAEGIDALVLDVKVGRGAFMKDRTQAEALARSLIAVGNGCGLQVRAVLTRMDAPLGRTIGNALEVREALEVLHGRGPADVVELTCALAAEMLVLGGRAADLDAGWQQAVAALQSGAARRKFAEMLAAQGADPLLVERPDDARLLPQARFRTPVGAPRSGFITDLDPYRLGQLAMRLGAGRARAEDTIDPTVGLELPAPLGSRIVAGMPIVVVHHNAPWTQLGGEVLDEVHRAVQIGASAAPSAPLLVAQLGS